MVDFAGWEMPVQYSTITAEHQAVRTAAGLFDIAHMGRLRFSGTDAGRFLDRIVTADVASVQVGQVRYALVCNERGGILDDVLVYNFADFYLLVVNASNRTKIISWIDQHSGGFDFQFTDDTFDHFMLAIQGPKALSILHPLVAHDISRTTYYWGDLGNVMGAPGIVSRTGYTGEDGFEVILPVEHGPRLWEALVERGAPEGLLPAGLGCRDTLRLEAAMPLYGHELDETIDPYTAGLGFAVKLNAKEFIGREALVEIKKRGDRPVRVGLELQSKRIAREGTLLYAGDRQIGRVASGTFSPTLQKSIAMAYVAPEFSTPGTAIEADLRGKREPARAVKLPFYTRAK
jgi:aminomethyltransferase